ncbi:4'-phosphopantetheinyl transferase family protein [Chelatococcus sp. GCM10030263]|uniref:4'-phosphopantetheinyl transferase family protein n=1 Tax=Chelatococcus sp. GCM10030263 TaxID=3273387 RepID=UPI0036064933
MTRAHHAGRWCRCFGADTRALRSHGTTDRFEVVSPMISSSRSPLSDPLRWPSPEAFTPLEIGHVHLWSVDLSAVDPFGSALPLSSAEEARAMEFRFLRDAHRFRVAMWMRRSVLGRYLDRDPAKIAFRAGAYGRPELDETGEPSRLRFNASHSDTLSILAVTLQDDVGVDIEIPRPLPDCVQLARDTFHPLEVRAIEGVAGQAEREAAFYRCWTRKEALAKAVGLGFHLPFNSFAVEVSPRSDPALVAVEREAAITQQWALRDISVPPQAYIALAMRQPVRQIAAWSWRPFALRG